MGRRLAAIPAADVVGYSRLMAADENGTHTRYKALRTEIVKPRVAEHRGRVVKLMGDGALVEFASAVDAVECALAIPPGWRRFPNSSAPGRANGDRWRGWRR
jgi:adenylate cyclase